MARNTAEINGNRLRQKTWLPMSWMLGLMLVSGALAAPTDLDPDFGDMDMFFTQNGVATTQLAAQSLPGNMEARALVVLPEGRQVGDEFVDGGYVIVGLATFEEAPNDRYIAMSGYTETGEPRPMRGGIDYPTVALHPPLTQVRPPPAEVLETVIEQGAAAYHERDGIPGIIIGVRVVAREFPEPGATPAPSTDYLVIARFNLAGLVLGSGFDPDFGVIRPPGTFPPEAGLFIRESSLRVRGLAVDSQNRILVLATQPFQGTTLFGSVDTGFGTAGITSVRYLGGAGSGRQLLQDLDIDGAGRALLVGARFDPASASYLARLAADGTRETDFAAGNPNASDGFLPESQFTSTCGVRVLPDGRILIISQPPGAAGPGFRAARYLADLSAEDDRFARDFLNQPQAAVVRVPFTEPPDNGSFPCVGIHVDDEGRIVVAGSMVLPNDRNGLALVRLLGGDLPPVSSAGRLGFESASVEVGEDAGTLVIPVRRTESTEGAVEVGYRAVDGTAVNDSDFELQAGTLSFTDGQSSAEISVTILDNQIVDGDRSFTLVLENPGGGAVLGTSSIEVTILDDDQAGTLRFAQSSLQVIENEGILELQVQRVQGTAGEVSVDYRAQSGTAVETQDFRLDPGTLTFAAGVTARTVEVEIIDNEVADGNRSFSVVLENPTGGAVLGDPSQVEVTILDDDNVSDLAVEIDPLFTDTRLANETRPNAEVDWLIRLRNESANAGNSGVRVRVRVASPNATSEIPAGTVIGWRYSYSADDPWVEFGPDFQPVSTGQTAEYDWVFPADVPPASSPAVLELTTSHPPGIRTVDLRAEVSYDNDEANTDNDSAEARELVDGAQLSFCSLASDQSVAPRIEFVRNPANPIAQLPAARQFSVRACFQERGPRELQSGQVEIRLSKENLADYRVPATCTVDASSSSLWVLVRCDTFTRDLTNPGGGLFWPPAQGDLVIAYAGTVASGRQFTHEAQLLAQTPEDPIGLALRPSSEVTAQGTVTIPVAGGVLPREDEGGVRSSGCFIATAAYGSWLDPQVAVLRDFRDHRLVNHAPGRAFVDWYYRQSPPLADWIAERDWARAVVRIVLAPVIEAIERPVLVPMALLLLLLGLRWRQRGRWSSVGEGVS